MKHPTIIVTISKDGKIVEFEGQNFVGSECNKAMDSMERSFGKIVSKRIKNENLTQNENVVKSK